MKIFIAFVKKYWFYILIGLGLLLILPVGKALINRVKLWMQLSNINTTSENGEIDYSVLAMQINDALHGGLTEDEETVISIVNAMPTKKEYSKLVLQYAKTAGKDLRNDCIKYMTKKQYSRLKYQ